MDRSFFVSLIYASNFLYIHDDFTTIQIFQNLRHKSVIVENLGANMNKLLIISISLFCVFILSKQAEGQVSPSSYEFTGTVVVNSPASIGNIDLAFHIQTSGISIEPDVSYIMLQKTALFPKDGQLDGEDIGPKVASGTLSDTAFNLTTYPFLGTVSGKSVTRQITLDQATVGDDGDSLTGIYTETITGYTPQPMQVIGRFVLVRPSQAKDPAPCCQDVDGSGSLSLDEIRDRKSVV